MRAKHWLAVLVLLGTLHVFAADSAVMKDRRLRAAKVFHDGILLLHASSRMDVSADGFHQDAYFYYLTGLENTVGALFAIDGKSGESWLFLPTHPPFQRRGLQPEAVPGADSAKRLEMEHVADWAELEPFLAQRASAGIRLYYADDSSSFEQLPPVFYGPKAGQDAWVNVLLQKYPSLEPKEASEALNALMATQSPDEQSALRSAAKATVTAIMAGLRTIRPGTSQRHVEAVVENTCWNLGAHGSAFWPWAFAGESAVFPRPFFSMTRYDHLDAVMRAGDLVRLDVGCEWSHYSGDLGRTVPVSGRYADDQRETWTIFVAAYRAGAGALREGVKLDQVYDIWRQELLAHRATARTALAQHAIDSWSKRENVPFWQIHATNLVASKPPDPLRAGVTINFEPIASVDGQGFFLEDMYLITKDGAELLTPGVPYSADDIEAAMR